MTTDTREKLNETLYFLKQMEAKQPERDNFKFNLSAFLSAARSITLIMQKEFSKVPDFNNWYEGIAIGKDEEMKFFNRKRILTIHQKPVKPRARVDVNICVPTANITINAYSPTVITTKADEIIGQRVEPEQISSKATSTSDKSISMGESVTTWRWYFEEFPDMDVLTLCKEHSKKLEALVSECESLFT